MFKFRIIGFTLLLGILCGIFFWRPWGIWLFVAVAPALAALAVAECAKMLNDAGRKNLPAITALLFYAAALGLCACRIFKFNSCNLLLLLPAAALIAGFALLKSREKVLDKLLNSFGILALLAPGFLFFLDSFFLTEKTASNGIWLFFLCLVTKATDSGGYIFGTLTSKLPRGNHKIAPNISPKKSWEGLAGGMLLSLAAAWGFYQAGVFTGIPLWWFITAGIVLSLGSFFGDLAESAIKRISNIKDSGHWVPGMGGAFDVLDSFIFNGTLFFLLLKLI